MKKIRTGLLLFLLFQGLFGLAQDSSQVFKWTVQSKKLAEGRYEIVFTTGGNGTWNLYAPDQDFGGVAMASLNFTDSSVRKLGGIRHSGTLSNQASRIFEGEKER